MTRLAHLSDLHFGTEDGEIVEGLLTDLAVLEPTLVVVSGDLTQRARRNEFVAARAFLDRIHSPKLVVPGNHDIPLYNLVSRFARPFARFQRYIAEEVEPFFLTDTLAVLGVNTARSDQWKEGRVSLGQIEGIQRRMRAIPSHVFKVLVTHHPFLPPPGNASSPVLGRAEAALHAAEAGGVDLMLAGHLHVVYSGDVRAHFLSLRRSMVVAQAGTATSRRVRNEANSYNVIDADPTRLSIALRVWQGSKFEQTRSDEYVKRAGQWATSAD